MDLRRLTPRTARLAALTIGILPATVWAQGGPTPIRFTADLDGAQSVAINSTALETRTGTGSAQILFDPVSGDLSYEIEFEGLIAEDITLGDPAINPDGTPTPPGTVNGNALDGGGLFLLHFHVGAPGANGPIPVDIVAQTGPAIGVLETDPTPIQGAATGRVTGAVNIFDLAVDGFLLNGVPVDGRDDGIRSPDCVDCGLIEAFLSNNVYVNIHTFNNPFGETRGQALAQSCSTLVNTIEGLRTLTADAVTSRILARLLDRQLRQVDRALAAGRDDRARRELGDFLERVTHLNTRRLTDRVIPIAAANDVVCAAANILSGMDGDDPADPEPEPDDGDILPDEDEQAPEASELE